MPGRPKGLAANYAVCYGSSRTNASGDDVALVGSRPSWLRTVPCNKSHARQGLAARDAEQICSFQIRQEAPLQRRDSLSVYYVSLYTMSAQQVGEKSFARITRGNRKQPALDAPRVIRMPIAICTLPLPALHFASCKVAGAAGDSSQAALTLRVAEAGAFGSINILGVLEKETDTTGHCHRG